VLSLGQILEIKMPDMHYHGDYSGAFELNRLFTLLKKGGVLAIMTQMITKETDFSTWYYKNDPTHICFFSQADIVCYITKTTIKCQMSINEFKLNLK
jgi:hypothetical protein